MDRSAVVTKYFNPKQPLVGFGIKLLTIQFPKAMRKQTYKELFLEDFPQIGQQSWFQ